LPSGALLVLQHLTLRRLSDINNGLQAQMAGCSFGLGNSATFIGCPSGLCRCGQAQLTPEQLGPELCDLLVRLWRERCPHLKTGLERRSRRHHRAPVGTDTR
jgi:hypothetical protein